MKLEVLKSSVVSGGLGCTSAKLGSMEGEGSLFYPSLRASSRALGLGVSELESLLAGYFLVLQPPKLPENRHFCRNVLIYLSLGNLRLLLCINSLSFDLTRILTQDIKILVTYSCFKQSLK